LYALIVAVLLARPACIVANALCWAANVACAVASEEATSSACMLAIFACVAAICVLSWLISLLHRSTIYEAAWACAKVGADILLSPNYDVTSEEKRPQGKSRDFVLLILYSFSQYGRHLHVSHGMDLTVFFESDQSRIYGLDFFRNKTNLFASIGQIHVAIFVHEVTNRVQRHDFIQPRLKRQGLDVVLESAG
jgi:hypothetical protein